MSQLPPQAGRGRPGDVRGWPQARLALAIGLLVLVVAGMRTAVPAPSLDGPFRHDGLPLGVALEAVLACLLAALAIRNSRAPRDALLAARLRRLLIYVVVAGLVAVPTAYLLSRHVGRLKARPPIPASSARPPGPLRVSTVSMNGNTVLLVVLALAAAALVYGIVRLFLKRPTIWAGWRRGRSGIALEPAAEEDDDEAELLEAVESGQSALRLLDDARAAIIACYVAMEQNLAQAGTARAVADTPDELLARAARQGLVRGDAAARLTALFYEARFSSHLMPPQRRDQARQALDELAADLRDLEPAGRGAGAADGLGGADGAAGRTGGAAHGADG
jgi:hypothetical protein